jgi:hypothetical protein
MPLSQLPAVLSDWFTQLVGGLDRRSAPRLCLLLYGALFARGRRTVTSWFRAAGQGVGGPLAVSVGHGGLPPVARGQAESVATRNPPRRNPGGHETDSRAAGVSEPNMPSPRSGPVSVSFYGKYSWEETDVFCCRLPCNSRVAIDAVPPPIGGDERPSLPGSACALWRN